MSTPVDDLIAEIGCAADLKTVARLQRYLTVDVLDHWQVIVRETGADLEWEQIAADIERVNRAAEQRRAELTVASAE